MTTRPPEPWSRVAPAVAAAYSVALAYAAVCHTWQLARVHLTRLEWGLALAGGIVLLFWPLRLLFRRMAGVWARERRTDFLQAVAASVCCGFVVNGAAEYRLSQFADNLWTAPESVQGAMRGLLALAQASAFGLAGAIALTGIVRVTQLTPADPPPPVRPDRSTGAFVFAVAVGLGIVDLMVWNFVRAERTAHYWDFMGYWLICADFSAVLAEAPSTAFDLFVQSVRGAEYTLFPALAPSLGMALFGDSRMAYVLAVSTVYGGLILIAAVWGTRRIAAAVNVPTDWLSDLGVAVLVAFLPLIWAPTVRGYLDLGGVAIGTAVLGLTLSRPVHAWRWQQIVAVGLGLAALTFFRRWYSFWAVSFLAVAGAEAAVRTLSQARRRAPVRRLVREGMPLVAVGAIALAAVLSFSWLSVVRIAGTSYGNAYGAYRSLESPWARLHLLLSEIGYGYVLLFAAAAASLVWDARTRRVAVVAASMAVVMHLHFHRIQDMGWHHRLLYAPSFLVVVGLAGAKGLARFSGPGRLVVFAGLAIPYALACLTTFLPGLNEVRVRATPFAPRSPTYPEVREDIDELVRLATDLNRESERRATSFAVVASSAELNQTHVLTVHRSLGLPGVRPTRQRMLAEVDRVNGFPHSFFECGVVAVATPPQIHLRPDEQQIFRLLAHDLTTRTGLGGAFEPLPGAYRLVNGIAVTVSVRTRPFTGDEVTDFRGRVRAGHPGLDAFFEPREPVPLWPTGMR